MKNTLFPIGLLAGACLLLAACDTNSGHGDSMASRNETTLITVPGEGPPDARPGACYGKDVTPAVIEVVTEQELIEPAKIGADGGIIKPAVYESASHQAIVEPRKEFFFEVPCADTLTPDFIASLQRALKARRLYRGNLSGIMDERTRRAIRKFQLPGGLNSDILTMDTALKLGLIAYGRETP